MSEIVTTSTVEEGIYRLHLDDAEHQNKLSEPLSREIIAALDRLATEPSLKVLLLTGREDVFCAGATLELLERMANGDMSVSAFRIPQQMLSFPLPIIGALQGHAVGGGLSLALCCDMTVAADRSRYGANFTELGFTPGMGITSLLAMQVGHALAGEMLLGAKLYRGRELERSGLFNAVVPAGEVMPTALDLARRIADKPRDILAMLKETLSLPRRRALAEASTLEELMHAVSFTHPRAKALIRSAYID